MTATAEPVAIAPAASTATAEAVTPAPETTPPVTEVPATPPAKAAVGVEDYKKIKAMALKGEVASELEVETPTPEETPPVTETPPVETPPAETTPEVTPVVETPTTTEPVEPTDKEPPSRIRIGRLAEKDRALLASATELAAAENIDFSVAWARITGKPETAAPVTPTETGPKLRTRAEVEADIQSSKQERKAAATAVDALETGSATRMVDAAEKLELLQGELADIDFAEAQAEAARAEAERQTFDSNTKASKAKTAAYWPEAEDPKSELSQRVLELADQYEKDPALAHLVSEADAPFYFTQIAAKEIWLAPAHLRKAPTNGAVPVTTTTPKSSTPTATKPAPVTQRAVVRATPTAAASPASGEARTTTESAEDKLGLDKVRGPHGYHELVGRLTGKKY